MSLSLFEPLVTAFHDERDAEDAIRDLQGKQIAGSTLNIEWTKESGRFKEKSVADETCYECGQKGHFAKNCRDRKGGARIHRY
jgi:arginine/serine-rich splicing factor 7